MAQSGIAYDKAQAQQLVDSTKEVLVNSSTLAENCKAKFRSAMNELGESELKTELSESVAKVEALFEAIEEAQEALLNNVKLICDTIDTKFEKTLVSVQEAKAAIGKIEK